VAALSGPLYADCKLGQLAEIPVTMIGLRPTVVTQINGVDTTFMVDSGAFFSNLSPAKAAELKLPLSPAPRGLTVIGIGGSVSLSVARVRELTLLNFKIPNVELIVGGSEIGDGVSGLLGQNLLSKADVEYDLAKGVIRLIRPQGCGKTPLAYWAGGTQLPYSVMDIGSTTPTQPQTVGVAFLNGTRIRVMFDSGASTSFVSGSAAQRAGIKLDSPDVKAAGFTEGLGAKLVKTWIAPVGTFKVGDEEIQNTRLRITDTTLPAADMLIGADFFLSHHIYVASSQHKLYFTYNGGPVFNLNKSPLGSTGGRTTAQASPPGEPAGADSADSQATAPEPDGPKDAAGYSRRGTAFAARRDFEHAIADLTRACELDPAEATYFFERGEAHWHNEQPLLAAADFDRALQLRPNDIPSLLSRAEMRQSLTWTPRNRPPRKRRMFDLRSVFCTTGPSSSRKRLHSMICGFRPIAMMPSWPTHLAIAASRAPSAGRRATRRCRMPTRRCGYGLTIPTCCSGVHSRNWLPARPTRRSRTGMLSSRCNPEMPSLSMAAAWPKLARAKRLRDRPISPPRPRSTRVSPRHFANRGWHRSHQGDDLQLLPLRATAAR
jgi:predicted aspartyl protease